MNMFKVIRRSIHSLGEHKSLVIDDWGDPAKVVKLVKKDTLPIKAIGENQVLVSHLAACINPSDVTLISGRYGFKPPLPAILGNEGVLKVLEVGPGVRHLKSGDTAVGVSTFGYWQSYSVQNADTIYKVDGSLDQCITAQLKVNPCTAFRMMKDFVNLKPGDVMIQNAANSAVGVYAIQLAKHWGIKTINVIREKHQAELDEITKELKDFGADYVVTEKEISNVEIMKPILKQIGKPKLALDCVGGKNAQDCGRILDENGISVVYGAMSRQPAGERISTSAMIFKDIYPRGFWVSRWYKLREATDRRDEISAMLDEISDMFKRNILKPKRSTMITFEERNIAFSGSSKNTKYLFSINKQ